MQGLNVHYIRTGRKTGTQAISPVEVLARQKFVQLRRSNKRATPREAYDIVVGRTPFLVPAPAVAPAPAEREFVIDAGGRLVDTHAQPDGLIWRPVAAVRSDEHGMREVDPALVPISDSDVIVG